MEWERGEEENTVSGDSLFYLLLLIRIPLECMSNQNHLGLGEGVKWTVLLVQCPKSDSFKV